MAKSTAQIFEEALRQVKMREAFILGCVQGKFPMTVEAAVEIADVKYPMPDFDRINEETTWYESTT